jgi:small neutral amino acid transporter SnatA (MarC family)
MTRIFGFLLIAIGVQFLLLASAISSGLGRVG